MAHLSCAQEIGQSRASFGNDIADNFGQVSRNIFDIIWLGAAATELMWVRSILREDRRLAERIEEIQDVYPIVNRAL